MALANFSLPFGALAQPWGAATLSPLHSIHQLASNTNNLLYSPVEHQQQEGDAGPPPPGSEYFKNSPYGPPQAHHQLQHQHQLHTQHQQQHQQQQTQIPQQQTFKFNANANSKSRRTSGSTYLPPIPPPGVARQTIYQQQQQQQQQHYSHYSTQPAEQEVYKSATSVAAAASSVISAASTTSRTYGEGSYSRLPTGSQTAQKSALPQPQPQAQPPHQYVNSYSSTQRATSSAASVSTSATLVSNKPQQEHQQQQQPTLRQPFGAKVETPATTYGAAPAPTVQATDELSSSFPERPPGFTRVQAGQGSRTQVHAVLDYDVEEGEDAEDYYDTEDQGETINKDQRKSPMPTVTPIQGPIFLKNGSVPVVPLFSYPTLNNGSFVQIPIWWTALSVALGLDVRGDIIKGVPCIKRYHQLFCPTAGNSYPIDKIERFIDDNKALMRRMYGDFEMNMDTGGPRQQTKRRKRRFIDEPDIFIPPGASPAAAYEQSVEPGDSFFGQLRNKRQAASGNQNRNGSNRSGPNSAGNPGSTGNSGTGRLDACESKIEIVTPYWASNSAGKIRAIVNTQHFEQAIHQEVCSKTQTSRCEGECGCEQKYKWHRLLAYDPDNDCKGIFMDWFLFPSCCVCRCNPR